MRSLRSSAIGGVPSPSWRAAIPSILAGQTKFALFPPAGVFFCLPQPSAFSLAAARMGWSLQDVALVTLHGRALEGIIRYLQPGARILALSWDGATPAKLAKLLDARRMGQSRIAVLEAMAGPRERVRHATASNFDIKDIVALK